MRCAKGNRGFKILAHTHTKLRKVIALGDFSQKSEMYRCLLIYRRNAHEPCHVELPCLARRRDKLIGLGGIYARFLRFAASVDLNETRQTTRLTRHFFGKLFGKARPVEGVDDIE